MPYLNTIYTAIVVFISLLALTLLLTTLPIPGINTNIMTVQSGSMEPAIKTGSLIIVRPSANYSPGDIITFIQGQNHPPVTHRVLEMNTDSQGRVFYTTQGDANETRDLQPVSENNILGSVRLALPFLGRLVDTARSPIGFTLMIIFPALIVVGGEIKNIAQELKNSRPLPAVDTRVRARTSTSDLIPVIDLRHAKNAHKR